jgi:hypothetical protein
VSREKYKYLPYVYSRANKSTNRTCCLDDGDTEPTSLAVVIRSRADFFNLNRAATTPQIRDGFLEQRIPIRDILLNQEKGSDECNLKIHRGVVQKCCAILRINEVYCVSIVVKIVHFFDTKQFRSA